MISFGAAIFVIGAAMGWWGCVLFSDSQLMSARDFHKKEMDAACAEIKRVRTYMSAHIGCEKGTEI